MLFYITMLAIFATNVLLTQTSKIFIVLFYVHCSQVTSKIQRPTKSHVVKKRELPTRLLTIQEH